MIHKNRTLKASGLVLTLGMALSATAQPNTNQPGAAVNPTAPQTNRDEQRQKERAERETMRKEWPRQVVRNFLTAQGFAGPELHDAVITHFEAQAVAQQAVQTAGANLKKAVDDGLPAAQISTAINSYRTAQEDYADKRRAAEAELDKTIGFSKDTKLEAALLLAGVLGDGPSFMNAGSPPWAGGGKKDKPGKAGKAGKAGKNKANAQPAPAQQ
jgi:hypothetical protein